MGFRGTLCVVASFLLVGTLIAAGLGSKKASQQPSFARLINLMENNRKMAELIFAHCRLELVQTNEAVEKLEFGVPVEKSSVRNEFLLNSRSLIRLDTQEILRILDSKFEKTLLGCLKKKDLMFLIPGDERESDSWYNRHLELIYTWFDAYGRRELIQSTGEEPSPSPASPPSDTDSPPSPTFFPSDSNRSKSHHPPSKRIHSYSNVQASTQKSSHETVFAAVAVTAASTLVLLVILFVCCGMIGSGRRKNDENPLLSLSLSDHSIASSHKSFTLGTSINNEKHANQSFNIKSDQIKMSGDFFVELHSQSGSKIEIPVGSVAGGTSTSAENAVHMPGRTGLPPLKPPPGRAGLPPLKPPPGRAISFQPPIGPVNASPSPPPPPPNPSAPSPPPPNPSAPSPPPPNPSAPSPPPPNPSAPSPPPPNPSAPSPPPPNPSAPSPPPPPPPPRLKTSGGPGAPMPGPPPPPPTTKIASRPPPPPGGGAPPPRAPPLGVKQPRRQSNSANADDGDADGSKTKLKPFFWDKVMANPDNSMVWNQINSGSFQFNEEMIESLFGYIPPDKNKIKSKDSTSQDAANQYIQLIDPKKSQNLAILLKALNVTTEEVCDALQEGNELPSELVQTLLKMAPTTDEELKLRLYSGELSRLGPAERFLKVLVDIPFAVKRLESLLFMCTLQEEETQVKESLKTLEAACTELRKSRLFLKLLEAVLKTGNRMNDGTFRGRAQAFKLDTLLKLSDVKGLDGKTTLLHFVVQEIIRTEGMRAARAAREMRSISSIKSDDLIEDIYDDTEDEYQSMGLQVVSLLGNELENVKKAATFDAESLTGTVAKLGHALIKARDFLNTEMTNVDEGNGFHQTLKSFVLIAEVDVMSLLEEEKRIMALVKSTGDYFHGNSGKDEGLRLFVIVRDFLVMLDKECTEVKNARKNLNRPRRKEDVTVAPLEPRQNPTPDPRQLLVPAIAERRIDTSSSDDDDP